MDITLLYDNAYEMLSETNVYSRPPEQFIYHDHRGEKYALLELVRSHPMIGSRRMSRVAAGSIRTCIGIYNKV